jgi:hypothetical protein
MTDKLLVAIGLVVLVVAAVVVFGAYAGGIPEGTEVFMAGDHTCVLHNSENGVVLDCFCPCEVNCGYEVLPSNTDEPEKKETPEPRDTPTDEPTLPPPPTQEPTDEPQPTQMAKANCGLGNREEGKDPNENACGKKTGEENEPSGPPGRKKDK